MFFLQLVSGKYFFNKNLKKWTRKRLQYYSECLSQIS